MTNPDTSPAVKRFDMEWNSPHSPPRMEPDPNGEYVRFTDYQKLAAKNERLKAEVEAQPEPVVQVKPLEWGSTTVNGKHLRDVAYGLNGLIAYEVGAVEHYVLVNGRGLGLTRLGDFGSFDAAKAAAQADYEKRTLSAITTRSEADVWEEAAKVADSYVISMPDDEADHETTMTAEAIAAALRERGQNQ